MRCTHHWFAYILYFMNRKHVILTTWIGEEIKIFNIDTTTLAQPGVQVQVPVLTLTCCQWTSLLCSVVTPRVLTWCYLVSCVLYLCCALSLWCSQGLLGLQFVAWQLVVAPVSDLDPSGHFWRASLGPTFLSVVKWYLSIMAHLHMRLFSNRHTWYVNTPHT